MKNKIVAAIIILLVVIGGLLIYWFQSPKDRCTNRDREINNCVPAGRCGPTSSIDAVTDCDVKNYDKKFNTDL